MKYKHLKTTLEQEKKRRAGLNCWNFADNPAEEP